MAYERTVWVNNETPLNQENLNKIEEGIQQLFNQLGLSETQIGDINTLLQETIARVTTEEDKSSSFKARLDLLDLENARVYNIEVKNAEQDTRLDGLDETVDTEVKRIDERIDSTNTEAARIDEAKTEKATTEALEIRVAANEANKADVAIIGKALGIAPLNKDGIVPSIHLPGSQAAIEAYATFDDMPIPGQANKIYKVRDTNLIYRWDGEEYTELSASLALGETSETAFRGDLGREAHDRAFNTYTIAQIDSKIGDIEAALDELLDEEETA